ncbi:hypothetical protein BX070DRAFT_142037 [Coemansia spiralis]|nr:hypothetical protein BX070DRAFT_142037 [Coemansia spiralis]
MQANDDKGQNLLIQQGKSGHSVLKEHFPEARCFQIYYAFKRISSFRRVSCNNFWTKDEEETLVQLVNKHGTRWKMTAEKMSTDCSPHHYQMFHRQRSKRFLQGENIWPREEFLRLEIVIELSIQDKLLSSSEQEDITSALQIHASSSSLILDKSALTDELRQQSDDLRKNRPCKEMSIEPDNQLIKKRNWRLVVL